MHARIEAILEVKVEKVKKVDVRRIRHPIKRAVATVNMMRSIKSKITRSTNRLEAAVDSLNEAWNEKV